MTIEILDTPGEVAETLAVRLLDQLVTLQQTKAEVHLGLTGGTIATTMYQRLGALAPVRDIDWSQVHLWWGDERWVSPDSPDRNDLGARAGLGQIWDRATLHRMPADESGDLDAAAAAYAAELGDTVLDVCLLGLGPDGHVASLFPGHRSEQQTGRVIAVRDSPKPPPERISLTLEVINNADEVWFVATGGEKAEAAARAISGDDALPSGRARGRSRTCWWLDRDAAAQLPSRD